MKVLTWNVNSIRMRLQQLLKLIENDSFDVICLQETKASDDAFPRKAIEDAGYNVYLNGTPAYNGVAILSKKKASKIYIHKFCGKDDARHLSILIEKINIHSIYVPAGGDVPDASENIKFDHKLKFLDEMKRFFIRKKKKIDLICGDLNVAPYEDDVWSHNQLKNVVSHTDVERTKLIEVIKSGGFVDVIRSCISPPDNVFTWWSYRSKDFKKNNRGRRLDHIWVTNDPSIKIVESQIIESTRSLEKPSDHVPIFFEFKTI